MAETAIARSPLAQLAAPPSSAALTLREAPFHGMVVLRLDPRDRGAHNAVESALVAALPDVNRAIACTAGRVLWMGPDEFMIIAEPGGEASLMATLSAALRGRRGA